jgi:hypothetical protein
VVAVLFGAGAWFAPDPITRLGHALVAAGATFVGGFLYRIVRRGQPMPNGLDFAQSIARYRAGLEFARNLARTYAWWYILPLAIGPTIMAIAGVIRRPDPLPALGMLGFIALFCGLLVQLHALGARRTQKRIEQLAVTEEKTC